jgi:hypothetical protein
MQPAKHLEYSIEQVHAVVQQISRHQWRVYIATSPLTSYGPHGYGWLRLSEPAARRKAARELRRYRRRYGGVDPTPKEIR